MDKANHRVGVWWSVCKKQGWMIKLILYDQIKVKGEAEVKIIRQVCGIISPWQGYDIYDVSMSA